VIGLDGVTKRYGAHAALRDFSLRVGPGDVVALVGPNGAGKSTALKIVLGIVRPTAGRARINGFDVAREPERARALVGYVPQRLAFPDHVTCGDLCRLVAGLRGVAPELALSALADVALDGHGRTRVRELSGGQRQRLSLALALVDAPRALILDEPSISLDAEGAEVVCRVIAAAKARGAAVLFASHHLHEVAALADRVVVLRGGAQAAEAVAADLRDAAAVEAFYRATLRQASADAA
jgi:Cu-processing system ATP-binding protein